MDRSRKWRPKGVGYEHYGMQADIEYVKELQARETYRFPITELGGSMPKNDRIRRLVPWFEDRRVYLPKMLGYKDYEGRRKDLVRDFVQEEYLPFPVALHDDMLDGASRLFDEAMHIVWPKEKDEKPIYMTTMKDVTMETLWRDQERQLGRRRRI